MTPKKKKRVYPDPRKRKGTKKQRKQRAKKMQQLAQDRHNNNGAPSTYDPDFARQAIELCKRGATDAELADFFGVTTVTIWNWGTRHQDFFNACRRGKEAADERVERSAYAKATGYTYPSEKIVVVDDCVVRVATTEHVPPSDNMVKWWLINRKGMDWKPDASAVGFDPDKPLKVIVEGGLPK